MKKSKKEVDFEDVQMTNAGMRRWFDMLVKRMANPSKYPSKYTEEERDRIMRENKIGKYRTWQFDINRWNRIMDEVEDINSSKMIMAGITYYRTHYPDDAQFLSDEEIITRGLYRQLFRDRADEAHEFRKENKELEKNAYSEEFVK